MLITICKYLTGWFIPHYTERAISEKAIMKPISMRNPKD